MARARSFADLAVAAARSAERLDRYQRLRTTRPVPKVFIDHERALLEARCLRLLDAVRHMDDPAFRWDVEALA